MIQKRLNKVFKIEKKLFLEKQIPNFLHKKPDADSDTDELANTDWNDPARILDLIVARGDGANQLVEIPLEHEARVVSVNLGRTWV